MHNAASTNTVMHLVKATNFRFIFLYVTSSAKSLGKRTDPNESLKLETMFGK